MPIEVPKFLLTRPDAAEVRYLIDSRTTIAKGGPPRPPKRIYTGTGFGGEYNFSPHRVFVISGSEYPVEPLKAMTLPKYWWRYVPSVFSCPGIYGYVFSPRGDKNTIVCLDRSDTDSQSDFCRQVLETLKSPPHKIGADECKALELTYSNFQSLQTEDVNGRRVVLGEGISSSSSPFYLMIYHSQPEPYGCGFIRFTATPKKYKQYIKAVKASFHSIEWETARKQRSN